MSVDLFYYHMIFMDRLTKDTKGGEAHEDGKGLHAVIDRSESQAR